MKKKESAGAQKGSQTMVVYADVRSNSNKEAQEVVAIVLEPFQWEDYKSLDNERYEPAWYHICNCVDRFILNHNLPGNWYINAVREQNEQISLVK